MINILNTKANIILEGRFKFSMNYVSPNDINNKIILNVGCGWLELNALKKDIKSIVGGE